MKNLFLITTYFLFSLNCFASALPDPENKIPYDEKDFLLESNDIDQSLFTEIRIKNLKCNDKKFGLIYKVMPTIPTPTTRLVAFCERDKSKSIQSCKEDNNQETRICYNKLIKYYDLPYNLVETNTGNVELPETVIDQVYMQEKATE